MQMKTFIFIGITTLFAMTGCRGGHSSTDEFITVDVDEGYSTKKNWSCKTSWMWNTFLWKQTMSLLIKDMYKRLVKIHNSGKL